MNPVNLNLQRFTRFLAAGAVSTLLYFLLASLLLWKIPERPVLASTISYVACIAISFLLQKHYTFRSKGDPRIEGPRFVAASITGLVLSTLIVQTGTAMDAHPMVAYGVVATAVPPLSYILLALLVFIPDREVSE